MEDPEVALLFVSPQKSRMTKDRIQITFSKDYDRKILSSHEPKINQIWEERQKKNPKLFNGSKFRLHGLDGESSSAESSNVTLRIGTTDYKSFLGTNWSPDAKLLQQLGIRDFGNSQAYLADPLGVGAILLTADNDVVFIKRSLEVGEAEGLWDCPGGHPEPKEVNSCCEESISGEEIVKEIINSSLREIEDEVNVPMLELDQPFLLGIATNKTSAGRASAEFFTRTSLTSLEVKLSYFKGGSEAEESTNIKFIPLKDLQMLPQTDFWSQIAPSAKGCVMLYNQWNSVFNINDK